MRRFWIAIETVAVVAALAPAFASAQQPDNAVPATRLALSPAGSGASELRPGLTQDQFEAFTAAIGPFLHYRQVSDATTLGDGKFELGVQVASMPFDDSKGVWTTAHKLDRSISYPQVVLRYGATDRVDVGAWGALDPSAKYGVAGFDTRIALMRQADGRPVSVMVRPSIGALIYPSQVLAGTMSVDLSVSRAFGAWSPYGGLGGSSSGAVDRSDTVDRKAASANHSFAFAGLSYRWRTLVLSGEAEKGHEFSYAFRVSKRF